jgi:hypothetical protein
MVTGTDVNHQKQTDVIMAKRISFTLCLIGLLHVNLTITTAQTLGQTDTFQDGTLNSWTSGLNNPNPPLNISTGGPQGNGDRYMRATSSGGSGAGSKLVLIDTTQWKGNYITAGIGNIHMFLKNEGSSALQMRIVIFSVSGSCSSVNAVSVPVGSEWIAVNFPLSLSALTGGTVNTILSNVTEIRLLHRTTPGTMGNSIVAQLGIDNITASSSSTNVNEIPLETPRTFELYQNFPNPFNPSTIIKYDLPFAGFVTLKVFDVLGKEVRTLINTEMKTEGTYSVQFNASSISSGMYFYRLEAGKNAQVKRLVIIK